MDGGIPVTQTTLSSPYLTVDAAQSYFDVRLHSDAWDDASLSDKTKALATATRAIDRLNFIRYKAVDSQLNEFPRVDDTTVPQDILNACCEEAITLLDGADPEFEMAALHSTQSGYSSVRDTYDRNLAVEHVRAGIMSPIAWNYLKPWLFDSQSISFVRV